MDGKRLKLTNLDKVLYPESGTTKGEVVHYYSQVAEALLPLAANRPATFRRFPDGVEAAGFFAKNVPRGTPDWVRRITLDSPGSSRGGGEKVTYPILDDLPTLVWAANLAALELHVPQWTIGPKGATRRPDRLVVDLDPGSPATVVECCRVAQLVREVLDDDGLTAYPTTSGSKGLQVYAPIKPTDSERVVRYAKAMAERLTAAHPNLVLARMEKSARRGKVFLDWSQNTAAKTTVLPYSLRARPLPTTATPLTWDEVEACEHPEEVRFTGVEVAERLDSYGDLLADLHPDADTTRAALPRGT